ncbi:GntR family transcriptional regulator [Oryzibacter oryziterrae]|uniref:GntR family transcriptional regulator n=1 Tax=Oryzibacter oryziterrae TaxID=2766474 RepID=UPI001F275C8B|nr:GntR family transcriptional regulator [Oryzibacter oryziterrae]
MTSQPELPDVSQRVSVADQVFERLKAEIVTLKLEPGSKLSESDIATRYGVSRQPVRDAFFRLSRQGFLTIRPQRATVVSKISAAAVMQAQFIRTALEVATIGAAATRLSSSDLDALEEIVAAQKVAIDTGDHVAFHRLDDAFHREIAIRAGLAFSWDLVRDTKAHMDRVRLLSLSFSSDLAHAEHCEIMKALRAGDPDASTRAMQAHLSRVYEHLEQLRSGKADFFENAAV